MYRIPTSFPEYKFYTVDITFLEVKMEDYGHPFTCHAGVSAAYFVLQPPGNVPTGYKLLSAQNDGKETHMNDK